MSKENAVADSWEDADADPVKELMEKVEKVKLLQRKEEKKEAFFEKVKAEENGGCTPKMQVEEGLGPAVDEPKRVFLRRPKDGIAADNVVESSPPSATSSEDQPTSRSRPHSKLNQKEHKPALTYEERQAAYQAARNRILGTEYKPDNQEIKEIKFIDRSKSPETLKMTQKNMVEHYGEELSRELMQQPVEGGPPPGVQFLPDFSQPPPCMADSAFNGSHGFQTIPHNFPHIHPQQQFIENSFYMQMNGHVPVQYSNQGQLQPFLPQDPSAVSSSSQNFMESHDYYYPPMPQMTYVQTNMPNLIFPPPNFPPQGQNNQQMMTHMNPSQMIQMPQQNNQMMNQLQMQNGMNRGNNASVRGSSHSNGQNRQKMMLQGDGSNSMKPPPLMPPMQDRNSYRGGGNGQRQFQPSGQQNGPFVPNQSNIGNGRKQGNKIGKTGQQRGDSNFVQKNSYNGPQAQLPIGQNPIPFGCPPRHATAIREQNSGNMPINTGDGLLGAHPMASSQWPSLSSNRQH